VKVVFDEEAWDHYTAWIAEDRKVVARINALIAECQRDPFRGTGKPEPLKRNLTGWWSRRVDREHRLVYWLAGKGEAQALEAASGTAALIAWRAQPSVYRSPV
jgi:toxin YoeB